MVDFSTNEISLKTNFALGRQAFLNPTYKYRQESFIMFSSIFQLKLLSKSKNFIVDATFKSSPKNYYQMLNILCYDDENKDYLPVVHVFMTNKSYLSYYNIFKFLKNVLKQYRIPKLQNNLVFMTDFEKS